MQSRVAAFFQSLIPTKMITRWSPNAEPSAVAHQMDVDRVHQILRAAEAGNTSELFALYRDILLSDSHLQGEFTKRKLAVLGDPVSYQPADKTNADDQANTAFVQAELESCTDLMPALSRLLDATLLPVAVVEKVYRPSAKPGQRYEIDALVPVPDQLLDFSTGTLRIRDTDARGNPTGAAHAPDPTRYIVHRGHLLSTPDHWGGPMRSLVFWWLLGTMDRDWWGRFLDRYGAPFLVGKYDASDDPSRMVLERAFSFAAKIGGLVVTRETEVEIKQAASTQSADAYERFLAVCQREKSKLIVGHTLSAEAQATGLGSGQQHGAEKIRQDIRGFDAAMLSATLRTQLFAQLLAINGRAGKPPKILWGAESYDNAKIVAEILMNLKTAGLEPTEQAIASLGERLGFEVQRGLPSSLGGLPLTADLLALAAAPRLAGLESANQQIAREGAARLAQAFSGSLAPVRSIVLTSKSAEEVEQKLKALYADWPAARLQPLIESALTAHAGNAAAAF
jgi:phage gp29-like protein